MCLAQSATFNDPFLKSRVSWPFKAIHNENSSQIYDISFDAKNNTIFVAYDNSVRSYQIPKQWMPIMHADTEPIKSLIPKPIQNYPASSDISSQELNAKRQKINSSTTPKTKEFLSEIKANNFDDSSKNSTQLHTEIQQLRAELESSQKKIAMLESQLQQSQQKVQFYEETKIVFQFPKFNIDENVNSLKVASAAAKNTVTPSKNGNVSTFEINVKAPVTN